MSVIAGLDTRWAYLALVGLVALQRIVELVIARRNVSRLLARGGVEVGQRHYRWMVLLHTAFLVSCPAEVWLFERRIVPPLAIAMMALLVVATAIRFWVLRTLGERWTTRVIVLRGESPVRSGPYGWVRHPNYLAVILELLALPLIHTAWLTAGIFGLANGILLRIRIRTEEQGLHESTAYDAALGDRPRLWPGRRR